MSEVYRVLIDDFRSPDRMDIIIRNEKGFKLVLPMLKQINFVLYLDHDMGLTDDCHYEKSGYQLLMKMFEEGIHPLIVIVITDNPVGRQNIYAALRAEGYETNGVGEWSR